MSDLLFNFSLDGTNPEETGSSGTSPFIDSNLVVGYIAPESIVASKSQNGNHQIMFTIVDSAVKNGIKHKKEELQKYNDHQIANCQLTFTPNTWKEGQSTFEFVRKMCIHCIPADKVAAAGNAIQSILNKAKELPEQQKQLEHIRDGVLNMMKTVYAQTRTFIWVFKMEAKYTEKDNKPGEFYQNFYPNLNVYGITVRPNDETNRKEVEEYITTNTKTLNVDEGAPVTSKKSEFTSSNVDMGDISDVEVDGTEGDFTF